MTTMSEIDVKNHFELELEHADPLLAGCLAKEKIRQESQIELIASENLVSQSVLEALGSAITNKTIEGYPGARYHAGAKHIDEIERTAIQRACTLFKCNFANVQPHSGSQANQAVFLALLKPGDTVLSMSLSSGGHLSHGAKPNMSGQWFRAIQYGVDSQTGYLNYTELERLALENKPRLIIAGGSAYPRVIDFSFIRNVADKIGAVFLVDMAHFAGLVAGGQHPSPFPHAHVVSCTTTKTLRGPRGGLLLTNHEQLARKIDSAIFPGMQGSIHTNTITAKAVCLGEAMKESFRNYAKQVVENANNLAVVLDKRGFGICSGGTDTHLILVDLKPKDLLGKDAETALESVNITSNKNPVPGDPSSPRKWTGLRLGVASATTRGMNATVFTKIGNLIADTLDGVEQGKEPDVNTRARIKTQVLDICRRYPIFNSL